MLPKNLGGWHPDPTIWNSYKIQWPCGSIFENEGIKLYELVRAYKPKLIVEVGAHYGCSTTYLAYGIKDNGEGKIISIDIFEGSHSLVPKELNEFIEIVHQDALTYEPPKGIEMLFEDGAHTYGFTRDILKRYNSPMVVSHDYMHRDCQNTVKNEWDRVIGTPDEIYFEKPSDCGLAIKLPPKIYYDATKEREQSKDNKRKHKNRDKTRKTQEASDSNRVEQSGEVL